jgi:hypothetical protein
MRSIRKSKLERELDLFRQAFPDAFGRRRRRTRTDSNRQEGVKRRARRCGRRSVAANADGDRYYLAHVDERGEIVRRVGPVYSAAAHALRAHFKFGDDRLGVVWERTITVRKVLT